MKILMKIIGVLMLVCGLGLVGLTATSDMVTSQQTFYNEMLSRQEQREKDFQLVKGTSEEAEKAKEIEGFRKNLDEMGKQVYDRKQQRIINFVIGGLLTLLGIGLLGGSFLVGKKK